MRKRTRSNARMRSRGATASCSQAPQRLYGRRRLTRKKLAKRPEQPQARHGAAVRCSIFIQTRFPFALPLPPHPSSLPLSFLIPASNSCLIVRRHCLSYRSHFPSSPSRIVSSLLLLYSTIPHQSGFVGLLHCSVPPVIQYLTHSWILIFCVSSFLLLYSILRLML